jgi:protein-L-isoaspartate(D-aspartate) O-methyltransferase
MIHAATHVLGGMVAFAPCVVVLASCAAGSPEEAPARPADAAALAEARARMVEDQIVARGVADPQVLAAMRDVPRHEFVPPAVAREAYIDSPLPIGHGQTISQPYIVALMTELARPKPTDKALEVGTGSGYQAAVLSRLVARVYTIEIVEALAAEAAPRLAAYRNVVTRVGDGHAGWPEEAPFDVILVTAAPETIPPALLSQLAPGGRLVIPVGPISAIQELRLVERDQAGQLSERLIASVRFVPLVTRP